MIFSDFALGCSLLALLALALATTSPSTSTLKAAPSLSLYGVASTDLAQGFQISRINLLNGSQTKVGTDYPFDLNLYQQLAVDTKNNILYALLSDTQDAKLYLGGFQLPAVSQITMIALPFTQQQFLGVAQTIAFNPNNGQVLVSGIDPAVNNSHHILSVDPKSGLMTSVAVLTQDIKYNFFGTPCVFDWINNIWWSELVNDLGNEILRVAVNVSTGNITIVANTCNMESLQFDPKTGLVYGMGVSINRVKNTFHRTLCVLNSKTSRDKKVADFIDWGLMWSSTSALNPSTRQFYAIFAPVGKGSPWNLFSVNIDTLKFNSGPVIDNTSVCAECPSSLFIAP